MNCLLPRRSSQLKTVNAFIRWTVLRSFFEGGATFTTVAECCPYKHPISKMLFCFSDRLTVVKRKCASVPGTRSQTNLLWICGREGKKKTPNKNPMSGFQDLNKIESTKSWDCIWDLSPCFHKPLGLANCLSCSEDSVKLNHTYSQQSLSDQLYTWVFLTICYLHREVRSSEKGEYLMTRIAECKKKVANVVIQPVKL